MLHLIEVARILVDRVIPRDRNTRSSGVRKSGTLRGFSGAI
jgi:hypothetical protein